MSPHDALHDGGPVPRSARVEEGLGVAHGGLLRCGIQGGDDAVDVVRQWGENEHPGGGEVKDHLVPGAPDCGVTSARRKDSG